MAVLIEIVLLINNRVFTNVLNIIRLSLFFTLFILILKFKEKFNEKKLIHTLFLVSLF